MEEKLLYESKGCKQSLIIRYAILGIVLLAGGIFFFCLSGARYDTIKSGGFSLGGGYKFTKESRDLLKIVGLIAIAVGVMGLCMIWTLKSMWVKVYEGHIEGKAWGGFWADKQFYSATADIQSYEISNGLPFPIILKTSSGNHKVICKDSEKACAALQIIIKNK